MDLSLGIREASPADAEGLAALIQQLGFPTSPREVLARLPRLLEAGFPPLVAEEEGLIGCLTWHLAEVLHRPYPVGRISMLVVAEHARGRGVGRNLMQSVEARLARRGCGLVEVTSNEQLKRAHAFYAALGYERTSYRFAKSL